MRRIKRARTPFFFRYCFTFSSFEHSSFAERGQEKKIKKKGERKVCLESANEISPLFVPPGKNRWDDSLNWGLESGIFHSSRDCFNQLIHRESNWATSYSPIFEIAALRRWITVNQEELSFLFFFFSKKRIYYAFKYLLSYTFRVIINNFAYKIEVWIIRNAYMFSIFQPPCFLFAKRGNCLWKNSFFRIFEWGTMTPNITPNARKQKFYPNN